MKIFRNVEIVVCVKKALTRLFALSVLVIPPYVPFRA
jgi:hypothetical protein